jgi:hypothetical protein
MLLENSENRRTFFAMGYIDFMLHYGLVSDTFQRT